MADEQFAQKSGTEMKTTNKVRKSVASVILPGKKDVPPIEKVADAQTEALKSTVAKSILRGKLKREMEQELDPDAGQQGAIQGVHRSLPKMLFLVGAKAVNCPKMELEDDEAEVMADALSRILPQIDSKVYAVIVIICMTASKLLDCRDAISARMKTLGTKKQKVTFDKKKQAMVTKVVAK